MLYRPLANTGLQVSEVALGCWPIAGMTSPGVNDADSIATIQACFDVGINHLDTAYCYGAHGESERLIARALGSRRKEMVIATKGGIHWSPEGQQVLDARPATLRRRVRREPAAIGHRSRGALLPARPGQEHAHRRIGRRIEAAARRGQGAGGRGVERHAGPARGVRHRLSAGRIPAAVQHAPAANRGRHLALVPPARRGGDGLLAAHEGIIGRPDRARPGFRSRRQPPQVSDVSGRRAAEEPRPGRSLAGNRPAVAAIRWPIS